MYRYMFQKQCLLMLCAANADPYNTRVDIPSAGDVISEGDAIAMLGRMQKHPALLKALHAHWVSTIVGLASGTINVLTLRKLTAHAAKIDNDNEDCARAASAKVKPPRHRFGPNILKRTCRRLKQMERSLLPVQV